MTRRQSSNFEQLDLFTRSGLPDQRPAENDMDPVNFASFIAAGFECARLGNGHDLLVTTGHLPELRMARHYRTVRAHDIATVRDGLPWRHDPGPRFAVAAAAGIEAIWDLNHYDPPPDAVAHARRCAEAAPRDRPFWICPVNEPLLYPQLAGMPWEHAVDLAITMARVAKDHHPDVRVLTTDPITGIGNRQFAATDRLVAAGLVDVVGVNYYPHTARTSLRKVLLKTWRRYGKPVMVSETSWHDGHRVHHQRHPGFDKAAWLRLMCAEVEAARLAGAEVVGLCWYPIVDCPPWNHPQARRRWAHGLIRADGSVDPALSTELMAMQRRQAA